MATPIYWAQEVITCDLCDNPTQQFCNNCLVSLCEECINNHVRKHKSLPHDIVPFKSREIRLDFPKCEFHLHQRCEASCQQCDVPVCMKCVITTHNGHNVKDITIIFNDKKKEIQKETHEIESSIIPKYKEQIEETERDKTKSLEKFDELEKETEKHRNWWHQEVDSIFNKLSCLLKSMRGDHQAVLESHQTKLGNLIPDMVKKVQENKEVLRSNKVSDVTDYKSKLLEYRKIPAHIDLSIPILKTNTVQGKELKIELGEYKATLTQILLSSLTDEVSYSSTRKLLATARVIATIPIGVNHLCRLACVGADKVWVGGEDRTIKCFDIHGYVQDTVTSTYIIHPYDISVTRQGDLIYSNYEERTVNIFKRGKIDVMITTQHGWKPWGLCCSRSGDILVNVTNNLRTMIIRYQGKRVKQEIFIDRNGKQIYKSGSCALCMAENNNEDICVSDLNADIVIVMDKIGTVRFRYNGTPARRKNTFKPRHIVTDSMNQIIVADYSNDCLHILDQGGQFLKCIDSCELNTPRGLSVDCKGRLWVGLTKKGEVKVIQYMK